MRLMFRWCLGLPSPELLTRLEDPLQAHSEGSCPEVSVPYHVSLSIGLFATWQLASSEVNNPTKKEATVTSYVLVSEASHCHIHFILFVRSKSLSPVHSRGEGN